MKNMQSAPSLTPGGLKTWLLGSIKEPIIDLW